MKISIVTITFNSEKTVQDTFQSILKQEYRPLEYIVVDGKSTDSTINIIEEFAPLFREQKIEFKYISEKDQGISDAFNKGIKMASGDIIGIINSDDMLYDDALTQIVNCYDDKVNVYYGDCIVFNSDNDKRYLVHPKENLARLKEAMCIYHPSTFVTKKTYEQYGVFRTELRYCMDRELLLRYYSKGGTFLYIHAPLACYREGGVNQVYYKKNVDEGTKISIEYGMNPLVANLIKTKKIVKNCIWQVVQKMGMEKFVHKEQ